MFNAKEMFNGIFSKKNVKDVLCMDGTALGPCGPFEFSLPVRWDDGDTAKVVLNYLQLEFLLGVEVYALDSTIWWKDGTWSTLQATTEDDYWRDFRPRPEIPEYLQ